VIADNGDQLGVLTIDEAIAAANERGLDLVEVAPLARPPVVKIMDYGKFKFEQAKAARAAKKKQHVIHLKEVKYRPGIDDHDFDFKTRHAREFLQDGNKVKVTMMYRGRQMAHIELGREVLDRVAQELKDIGKIEQEPKLEAAICRWSSHRNEIAMPKMKSKRALRKRIRLTGTGKLRRYRAYRRHILTSKHPKRKRHLRKATLVSHAERRLKRLLQA